jgi:hypothetical protein
MCIYIYPDKHKKAGTKCEYKPNLEWCGYHSSSFCEQFPGGRSRRRSLDKSTITVKQNDLSPSDEFIEKVGDILIEFQEEETTIVDNSPSLPKAKLSEKDSDDRSLYDLPGKYSLLCNESFFFCNVCLGRRKGILYTECRAEEPSLDFSEGEMFGAIDSLRESTFGEKQDKLSVCRIDKDKKSKTIISYDIGDNTPCAKHNLKANTYHRITNHDLDIFFFEDMFEQVLGGTEDCWIRINRKIDSLECSLIEIHKKLDNLIIAHTHSSLS